MDNPRTMQKGILQKPMEQGKLQNRYRARWVKDKMGIGLDEHCANSYIPHVQHIVYICRNLHITCYFLNPSIIF